MTQVRAVAITALTAVLAIGCENASDGGTGGTRGGDCELPVSGTTVAPSEITEAVGVTEFQWTTDETIDNITVDLIGRDDANLGTFTVGLPTPTLNFFTNGVEVDGGAAALAGPLVARLETGGETVQVTFTNTANPDANFARPSPDDANLVAWDIFTATTTQEIVYQGRTLLIDERYYGSDRKVVARRLRIPVGAVSQPPTLGRRVTLVEPGEDESSLPVFVEYFVLEVVTNEAVEATDGEVQQWLGEVGLGSWRTATALQMFSATAFSEWQRDLPREVVRCLEGDEGVSQFDGDVVWPAAKYNFESCRSAALTTTTLGIYILGPAQGIAASLPPLTAFVAGSLGGALFFGATSFWIDCLCLDSDNQITDLCGGDRGCDGEACSRYCKTDAPPDCGREPLVISGSCRRRFISPFNNIERLECVCESEPGTSGATLGSQAGSCGDPHIDSFDSRAFSPQVAGELVLAEAVAGDPLLVQVRQRPWNDTSICGGVSVNTAAATELDGAAVFIDGETREVRIDNVLVDIQPGEGLGFSDGSGVERRDQDTFYAYYPDGSTLTVEGGSTTGVSLQIAPNRAGEIRGMFGTPDGDPNNELVLRDGTVLDYPVSWRELVTTYADSWRISQDESLFYYEAGDNTDTFTVAGFPLAPASPDDLPANVRAEAEATCVAAGVTGSIALNDCILDVGCTGLNELVEVHLNRSEERVPISLPVELENWSIEGPADPAGWSFFSTTAGGEDDADYNPVTTVPALLVSDREYSELILEWSSGNVSDNSEGVVGVLFEYQKPLAANSDAANDYDALLLAWSGTEPDAFPSPSAPTGWTLVRLSGVIDMADVAARFYAQQSGPGYEVLATAYAPEFGWINRTGPRASVVYRADRIEVTTQSGIEIQTPLAVEPPVGTEFGAGRVGLFTLGNDLTRWRDVTIAPLR